jgi:hypothetical protein
MYPVFVQSVRLSYVCLKYVPVVRGKPQRLFNSNFDFTDNEFLLLETSKNIGYAPLGGCTVKLALF